MGCLMCNQSGVICNICGEPNRTCDCVDGMEEIPCSCMVNPNLPELKIPSIEYISKAINRPVSKWSGNCFLVSSMMVQKNIIKGVARYGHWLGPVKADSMFFSSANKLGFVQHGWIETPEKLIVDPTRYVFESASPYIFYGEGKELYDVGGNKYRKLNLGPCPAWSEKDIQIELPKNRPLRYMIKVKTKTSKFCMSQLFWLANNPPDEFQGLAKEFYEWIIEIKHRAIIPVDNRILILGKQ